MSQSKIMRPTETVQVPLPTALLPEWEPGPTTYPVDPEKEVNTVEAKLGDRSIVCTPQQ